MGKLGSRTYNLDLLRIVAMLMIVTLHYLGKGQVFSAYPPDSLKYDAARIVESICLVSVNCYVLLSGYFLVHSDFKLKKLFALALQVVFYSLGAYLLLMALGIAKPSFGEIFNAAFPVLSGVYWFVTMYIAMYILSPFLNKLLLSMDREAHLSLITVLVAVFSVWPTLFVLGDSFTYAGLDVASGCSAIWFVVLYCIAAYIRKYYSPSYKIKPYLKRYAIIATAIAALYTIVSYLGSVANSPYFAALFGQMHGYNSLPVLVGSLSLFMVFINLKITNGRVNKCIALLSPLTLGVYLIHDEPHVRMWLWSTLNPAGHAYNPRFILFSIVSVVSIYLAASAIDWLRLKFFSAIGAAKWFQRTSNEVVSLTDRAYTSSKGAFSRLLA